MVHLLTLNQINVFLLLNIEALFIVKFTILATNREVDP